MNSKVRIILVIYSVSSPLTPHNSSSLSRVGDINITCPHTSLTPGHGGLIVFVRHRSAADLGVGVCFMLQRQGLLMLRASPLVQGLELHHAVVVLFVSRFIWNCVGLLFLQSLSRYDTHLSLPSTTKVINIYIIISSRSSPFTIPLTYSSFSPNLQDTSLRTTHPPNLEKQPLSVVSAPFPAQDGR